MKASLDEVFEYTLNGGYHNRNKYQIYNRRSFHQDITKFRNSPIETNTRLPNARKNI